MRTAAAAGNAPAAGSTAGVVTSGGSEEEDSGEKDGMHLVAQLLSFQDDLDDLRRNKGTRPLRDEEGDDRELVTGLPPARLSFCCIPLPFVGISITIEKGVQQRDSHADS